MTRTKQEMGKYTTPEWAEIKAIKNERIGHLYKDIKLAKKEGWKIEDTIETVLMNKDNHFIFISKMSRALQFYSAGGWRKCIKMNSDDFETIYSVLEYYEENKELL